MIHCLRRSDTGYWILSIEGLGIEGLRDWKRPQGTELQLVWGRRVIGRRHPGRVRWHIRRPFLLFVDKATLPKNPSKLPVEHCSSTGGSVVSNESLRDF